MKILEIKDLTKNFYLHGAGKEIKSCKNVNFSLDEGQFIGIVGLSGAGKSTILKCINRSYLTTQGEILYNSEAFGEIDLNVMPRTTAKEHVMNALLESGEGEVAAKAKAEEMLSYFKLSEDLWDIYPNTFSGGERLRLNLAHTMVKRPRFMLLDEPTASLDNKTKVLVKDMLIRLKDQKTSMIGIFHDLEFMDGVCDKVFNISEGKIV